MEDKKFIQELPDGYWSIIERYLPKYSSRQDIADNDDLTKFVEGEYDYTDPDDRAKIVDIADNYPNPELELKIWNRELLIEAMEAGIGQLRDEVDELNKLNTHE